MPIGLQVQRTAKALNRAFDVAYRAGRAANFQEFVAGLAATDRPPA